MGKAGKWIVNLLVGKKEEEHKKKQKIGSSFSAQNLITSRSQSNSQNMMLKWSFRKTSGNLITHKVSKSVDSIDSNRVLKQAMAEDEDEAEQKKQLSDAQNPAATKIQSAYRSHLARKALHALRGLVKIQALVRGHLVRKQTAATLKSMQALMAIQVRARANRIHMVEEEQLERRQSSSRRYLVYDNLRKAHKERLDMNLNELWRPYKNRSGYMSHSQIERIENETNPCSSRQNLAISKRQHQYENYSISTEPCTSQYYLSMSKQNAEKASFSMHQPRHLDCVPHNHPFYPNYMAKTESSRAKVRSHSEPKQRPGSSTRPKSKHREMEGRMSMPVDGQIQNSLENLKHNGYENHNPWFMKLYQLTKTSKNRSGDSISTKLSHSCNKKYNIAHEPISL